MLHSVPPEGTVLVGDVLVESRYSRNYLEQMRMDATDAPGGVLVYYADGDEEIIHANDYVVELFECDSVDDFMEYSHGSFRGLVHPDDLDAIEDSIWGQVSTLDKYDHIYYRIVTKAGRLVTVEDFGRLVETPGERPVFYVFLVELTQIGSVDWLTGLPSMVRFHSLARLGAQTIRGRGDVPVAVALDLVGMKSYNTQYGRSAGDDLLRIFADVLRRHFGGEACSRFAEDHFYAFAAEAGLRERVEALFADFKQANGGRVLPVRGGAYVCDAEDDIVAVGFDRAKIACDLDRKTWESHLEWFDDDMRAAARLRLHVLNHMEQSIEDGWIRPYYQAIVRSTTSDVCGEEALARWIDPEYGSLSPAQFVPVLEEAGLMHKLDMHIVDCVLYDMAVKRARGVPIVPVSVNISLVDLGKVDIAGELTKRADAAGVPHGFLRVEFTESAASLSPDILRTQISALHAAGFKVWMDDFGSGYSSLNSLKDFDFDLVKLDMGFIRGNRGQRQKDLIAGVLRIARKMGATTLAEGVETEEQALFLESVGCDMLQGFFFTEPQPLEIVMGRFIGGTGRRRENIDESRYWDAVAACNLQDPAISMDGSPMSEFPAGVVEYRSGTWRVARANLALRRFFDEMGVLPLDSPVLETYPITGEFSDGFYVTADRCLASGTWERIDSRHQYGRGLQFYIKPVASASQARAFCIASVPTMLGAALGIYGDVPAAYAVMRVQLDKAHERAVDAEYIYANPLYYEWGGYAPDSLTANSMMGTSVGADSIWLDWGYRAAVKGEVVHDIVYSPQWGHWLSFYMAPSPVEGCYVFAATLADDEHREQEEIIVGRDTSDLIVRIADALNGTADYDEAMTRTLEMISHIIHPKRISVFERGETTTSNTFEWCAPGVASQKGTQQNLDTATLCSAWDELFVDRSIRILTDMDELKRNDEQLYRTLSEQGISRTLAVPFKSGGKLIGYLTADDYSLDEGFDTGRLFEGVATFMGARIANHRLVEELERAGMYDGLTGLLNRRGLDHEIAQRLQEMPSEPFVLAFMDIDDFKIMNDYHGHGAGDAALVSLARAVESAFPAGSIIGRNGGDEFLVMMFGDGARNADALIHAFCARDLSCEYEGETYNLTMSVGYVGYPNQVANLQQAYAKADAALYAVKLADKAGALRYNPAIESHYRSQLGFTPRDIAENVPGAIMVHRAGGEGEILFANDELIEMFECDGLQDFMEYTGGTFAGAVHPDDAVRVYVELTSQLDLDELGAKNFANYRILTKAGAVKNVASNGRLVDLGDIGLVFYVLIIDRDEREAAKR